MPDTRILRHAPARAAIMAELLTDPILRELHEAALARVETRLAEYRETDAYRTLRAGLIAAGKVPIANVEAKPPKPRDPTRIAELMNRVRSPGEAAGGDAQPRPMASDTYIMPVDLSTPIEIEWFPNRELQLPADPRIFTAEALATIRAGKFERRHARNLPGYLNGCRRLLDIGGGVGFPVMCALRALPDLTVMLHEDRPGLAAAARMIHRHNGMENTARLRVVDGPLRLPLDQDNQATGLAACLNDFRPDALRLSSPETVPPQVLATMPLETVKRVIIGTGSAEGPGSGPISLLRDMGFAPMESRTEGLAVFSRLVTAPSPI